MVTGLAGRSYEERCLEVGLDTLERRRWEQDLVEVYRIVRGRDEEYGRELLPRARGGNVRTRTMAGEWNLSKTFARTDVRKHSFAVRVTDAWNSLDNETKGAPSMESFKNKLRKRL